jgi:hypothetical protein
MFDFRNFSAYVQEKNLEFGTNSMKDNEFW